MKNILLISICALILFPAFAKGQEMSPTASIAPVQEVVGESEPAPMAPSDPFRLQLRGTESYTQAPSSTLGRGEWIPPAVKSELQAAREVSPETPPVEATTAPEPVKAGVTPEEMAAAIDAAVKKAKAETLAEEAARRRRAQKREMANKAITHVIAVETRRLPAGVKGMERLKLLGDLLPGLKGSKR